MPTAAEKPTATSTACGPSAIRQPAKCPIASEAPTPSASPSSAAEQRQGHRLDQELRQDVPPPGADRQPQPDLARPLGDRDEHDVHDPDAADDQGDRGDRGQQHRQHAGGGLLRLRHVGQVAQPEIVFLQRLQPVPLAQQLVDLPLGGRNVGALPQLHHDGGDRPPVASEAPSTRLRAAASGISTTSSWSCPDRLCPLRGQHADHP